jgi:hypothetical protein
MLESVRCLICVYLVPLRGESLVPLPPALRYVIQV